MSTLKTGLHSAQSQGLLELDGHVLNPIYDSDGINDDSGVASKHGQVLELHFGNICYQNCYAKNIIY